MKLTLVRMVQLRLLQRTCRCASQHPNSATFSRSCPLQEIASTNTAGVPFQAQKSSAAQSSRLLKLAQCLLTVHCNIKPMVQLPLQAQHHPSDTCAKRQITNTRVMHLNAPRAAAPGKRSRIGVLRSTATSALQQPELNHSHQR